MAEKSERDRLFEYAATPGLRWRDLTTDPPPEGQEVILWIAHNYSIGRVYHKDKDTIFGISERRGAEYSNVARWAELPDEIVNQQPAKVSIRELRLPCLTCRSELTVIIPADAQPARGVTCPSCGATYSLEFSPKDGAVSLP